MIRLSLPDVAHIYCIPLSTLRRWLSNGTLTRHGSKPYKVDLTEVETVIRAKKRHALPSRVAKDNK